MLIPTDMSLTRRLLIAHAVAYAHAHSSLVIPTPRNAIDGSLPAFKGGGNPPGGISCSCADGKSCPLGSARAAAGVGQPCLWWSQGCSIGCDFCLTDPRHPENNGSIPTAPITGNPPHADKAGFRKSYCDDPKTGAVLPKRFWTMNLHAVEGAEDDSYRFNPWRAPGSAPVVDPCGQAGGKYRATPMGGASNFVTVNVSGLRLQMGDLGSRVLPPTEPARVTQWEAGSTPRVAWGMRFNHGGGYQYRLCPAERWPCTEADFQQTPLDFVRGAQAIMWNNGSLRSIEGQFVDGSVCRTLI